ncbi:hypothetical protein J2T60_001645 [Natronospira proteinivora]|uniref:Metallothionein n=1 Tax=Natronospira proteinivora TaxID=1807133 RepID=A0ABT1G9R3_9GAMM|nr:hypothetical protein [Natronospira proteinivora]MCP1727645.1 hypothetical protein [Natronospira proteinivora]
MSECEVCGNSYEHAFQVRMNGQDHTFDCFECAVHKLAPSCSRCGCRIMGHGVQQNQTIYCGAHCARQAGAAGLADHV